MVQKIKILSEIESIVKKIVPSSAGVTKIEMEGPEVVIYTKNPSAFFGTDNFVSRIAFELKKRVNIRTDKSLLSDPETARKKILELVPKEADVKDIYFEEPFSEVAIEAVKKGMVIGKGGELSKRIIVETGWTPRILRSPTTKSDTLSGIRKHFFKHADERRKFLLKTAEKIYGEKRTSTHQWIRFTALGGFREVGRSCMLLETEATKVLLDAGLNFSSDDPYPYIDALGYPLSEIDAIVISHAHSDHTGLLPFLFKMGYDGPVYCTEPTRDLMTLLQFDYLDVSVAQEKIAPYAEADVKNALLHTITRDYREVTDIAPDMRLTLHNASHILGSSSVHINIGEGTHNLVYSADIKFGMTRLFDNIDIKYPRMETLIIESTYGSKDAIQMSRQDAEQKLLDIIQETTQFGGNVLIPVFGVGRGQEICMVIEDAYKRGQINDKNSIYVDGMVREASAIHTAYPEYLRQSIEKRILTNDSPFDSPIFKEAKKEDREKICSGSGGVIISTSGMMNGGPVMDYFYKLAENPANTLVFVGYLAEGTFGRKIQQGLKTFPISDNGKTKKIEVKMRIETIDGFSGHSDFNQLVSYVASLKPKPKKIIVNHGDPQRSVEFSKYVASKFGVSASAIRNLETVRFR
ncbi:MAG: beta-CASP ribonuclease aCPSF1 [Candidatus Diapherotrites archaeon]|nr:beta-CASP ribonuclease aCPSF1 [Candidatus Diapherotrites archaeon]